MVTGLNLGIRLQRVSLSLDHAKPTDVLAAQTKMDFALGWFADPIYLGRYPQSMIDRLGDRLPQFTKDELKVVHGSSDVSLCA